MLYEHYLDIAAGLNQVIASLRAHPDARVRDEVEDLLQRVDLLHREALVRLVDALRSAGANAAVQQASADPVVRVLLGLYEITDIAPVDAPAVVGFVPLDHLRTHRAEAAAAARRPEETPA